MSIAKVVVQEGVIQEAVRECLARVRHLERWMRVGGVDSCVDVEAVVLAT